ncbi:hypothetical protein ACL02R_05615 [Streptomyces sp. MS19]|uniref:hypothetical protein n=1 Tax=Streptomyces sp. MS19 TaxID=3385972 RepID=UPI0039A1C52F
MRRRVRSAVAVAGLTALTVACGGGGEDGPGPFGGASGPSAQGSDGTGGDDTGSGDLGALEGLTAPEISERARQALVSVESLRVNAQGTSDSQAMTMDLHLDRAGSCVGSVSSAGTGSVEITVRAGEEVWMKPDAEFWQTNLGAADPQLVALLDGRYLHGSTSDPEMAGMVGVCALEDMLAETAQDTDTDGDVTLGETTEHDGVPAVTLHLDDPDGPQTMLVATEGEPYPLLLSGEDEEGPMEMALSAFDEPVVVEEPPAAHILEVADFRSGDIQA